jgi:hypothetical protein
VLKPELIGCRFALAFFVPWHTRGAIPVAAI